MNASAAYAQSDPVNLMTAGSNLFSYNASFRNLTAYANTTSAAVRNAVKAASATIHDAKVNIKESIKENINEKETFT